MITRISIGFTLLLAATLSLHAQSGGGFIVPGTTNLPKSAACLATDANGKPIVNNTCSGSSPGVSTFNSRNGAVTFQASDIPNTSVTPGSYTCTNITVGADGRVTNAANGTCTGGGGTAMGTYIPFQLTGGTLTIFPTASGSAPILIGPGGGLATFTSPATFTDAATSDHVFVYATSAGVVTMGYNSATAPATAGGAVASGVTAFPVGSYPLYDCSVSGSIASCNIDHSFATNTQIAGYGHGTRSSTANGVTSVDIDYTNSGSSFRYVSTGSDTVLSTDLGNHVYVLQTGTVNIGVPVGNGTGFYLGGPVTYVPSSNGASTLSFSISGANFYNCPGTLISATCTSFTTQSPVTLVDLDTSGNWLVEQGGGSSSASLPPTPVVAWATNENQGATSYDITGKGDNLTLNGSMTWTNPAGNYPTPHFNGTSQYMTTANATYNPTGTQGFTFSVWVYPTSNSGIQVIASTLNASTVGVNLILSGLSPAMYVFTDASDFLGLQSCSTALTLNAWNLITYRFTGSVLGMTLNGVGESGCSTNNAGTFTGIGTSAAPLTMGSQTVLLGVGNYFTGNMAKPELELYLTSNAQNLAMFQRGIN